MKNCIIVSVGLKGGGGKSTICANLAMHLIDQGIPVIFYDADIQQTLVRQRELAEHPNEQPPYQLVPFSAESMSLGSVVRRFRRLVPSPKARQVRYYNRVKLKASLKRQLTR